jgi:hypothetical protein
MRGASSVAFGISPDGGTIVGASENGTPNKIPVLWNEAGEVIALGPPPPPGTCCISVIARDATLSGSVVVGRKHEVDLRRDEAFIWDPENGLRSVQQVLESEGLDLTGWQLFEASAISHDGRSIAGQGFNPDGNEEAWLAVLPEPDADGDGVPDERDECAGTAQGETVDARGCSIADLCPCEGAWRSHSSYVRCVRRTAALYAQEGLIDREQRRSVVRAAAQSGCGSGSSRMEGNR